MSSRPNGLFEKTADQIRESILEQARVGTSIDVSRCRLGYKKIAAWQHIFTEFPESLRAVDLSWNALYACDASFGDLTETIPQTVDTVILASNGLGSMAEAKLKGGFGKLPGNTIRLDLQNNKLGICNSRALYQIISSIPASVRELNLTGNNISPETLEVLEPLFRERQITCIIDTPCLTTSRRMAALPPIRDLPRIASGGGEPRTPSSSWSSEEEGAFACPQQ